MGQATSVTSRPPPGASGPPHRGDMPTAITAALLDRPATSAAPKWPAEPIAMDVMLTGDMRWARA